MPAVLPEGLEVGAVLEREDPRTRWCCLTVSAESMPEPVEADARASARTPASAPAAFAASRNCEALFPARVSRTCAAISTRGCGSSTQATTTSCACGRGLAPPGLRVADLGDRAARGVRAGAGTGHHRHRDSRRRRRRRGGRRALNDERRVDARSRPSARSSRRLAADARCRSAASRVPVGGRRPRAARRRRIARRRARHPL